MDEAIQGIENLYAVGGLALGVILILGALILVVGRANLRAKEDTTPKIIDLVSQAQTANRELTTEIVSEGRRREVESRTNIAALTAIAQELGEGRKVQIGLVETVHKVNKELSDTRADIRTFSFAQDAGREVALTRVLDAVALSQNAMIQAVTDIVAAALKELKDALAPLQHRRTANTNVRKIAQRISAQIDELSKEIETYAKSHDTPPVSVVTTVGSLSVADDAPSPVLAPISADQLDTPDPASGIHWAIDGDK